MPTNRRYRTRTRTQPVAAIDALDGFFLAFYKPGRTRPFGGDRARIDEAWKVHGGELVRDWIVRHPGSRPFLWWSDRGRECPETWDAQFIELLNLKAMRKAEIAAHDRQEQAFVNHLEEARKREATLEASTRPVAPLVAKNGHAVDQKPASPVQVKPEALWPE
jgi:hypothetical protein